MKTVIKITQKPNGRYRAWCPSLPGCTAEAATHQEVVTKMELTVKSYLASLDVAAPSQGQYHLAIA